MHLVMMCINDLSVSAAKYVTHGKGLRSAIAFLLKFRGVNIVMYTPKITKFHGL